MAYVEFLAMKEEISEFLAAGYRMSAIYRELVSRKKITMSYPTFAKYVSGRYLKKHISHPDISTFKTTKEMALSQKSTAQKPVASADNPPAPQRKGPIKPVLNEMLAGFDSARTFNGADFIGTKEE